MTDDTNDLKTTETQETTEAVDIDAKTQLGDSTTEAFGDEPATRPQRDLLHVLSRVKRVPLILVSLLVTSGGVAAWLYHGLYRPDQQTDPSVARAAISAASESTTVLLSYSSETLDKDFANTRSRLGGDFLSYYETFTQQSIVPAAKEKSLKTTAHVKRAAISELHANSAVVLLFVDQSTTNKDNPNPTLAARSVLVTMTQVNRKWLITKFTPI